MTTVTDTDYRRKGLPNMSTRYAHNGAGRSHRAPRTVRISDRVRGVSVLVALAAGPIVAAVVTR